MKSKKKLNFFDLAEFSIFDRYRLERSLDTIFRPPKPEIIITKIEFEKLNYMTIQKTENRNIV